MFQELSVEECSSCSLLDWCMRGWGETHDNLKYICMKYNVVLIKTNACQKIKQPKKMNRMTNQIKIFLPRLSSANAKIMQNVERTNTAMRFAINFLSATFINFYIILYPLFRFGWSVFARRATLAQIVSK